ncbi:MAG: DegT/DnrJ/EryC1/StrS family aminotransferase, partial [Rhodospirillales bacterium]|nr:DegT/DnrJ/EryC1/StrS family aminotransferase [Rhodospirillales bacterium]
LGDVACFSFFPGKNLGAYGDGGAVTSNDKDLIETIRRIANHGRKDKYTHDVIGVNSRLDGLQGAVLGVKLPHMEDWNARRRSRAMLYDSLFKDTPVRPLGVAEAAAAVYHLYVVRVPEAERDRLVTVLNDQGIDAAVHYPVPLHMQPPLAGSQTTALPVTEQAAREVISLPVYPEMTDEDVHRVADTLKDAIA